MDVRVSAAGNDRVEAFEELTSWLMDKPELRGRIRAAAAPLSSGELGALVDALLVPVGSGGAASALVGSLRTFLAQPRRSDVRITVEGSDGRRVEVDAQRVDDVEALVRHVLRPQE